MTKNITKITGTIANSELIEAFEAVLDPIINDKTAEQLGEGHPETIRIGEKIIFKDNQEKYDAILEMLNIFLNFDETPENELYLFTGVSFKDGPSTKKVSLTISKEKATYLADNAKKYEDIFGDSLGIKFPTDLYQLQTKYSQTTLPGKDFPPPEPRLASEQPDEYEARIREYYETEGVTVDVDQNTGLRRAYPHETIDYRTDNTQRNDFTSESYNEYRINQLNQKMNSGGPRGNQMLQKGKREQIRNSELADDDQQLDTPGLFRFGKWRQFARTSENPGRKRRLGYAIAIAAGTATIVGLAHALGPAAGAIAVTGAVIGASLKWGVPFAKKLINKCKEMIYGGPVNIRDGNDEDLEKGIDNNPPAQGGGPTGDGGGNGGGPQGQPASQELKPDFTIEGITHFLADMGAEVDDLKELAARCEQIKDEMKRHAPESDEYKELQEKLINLTNKQKKYLERISEMIRSLIPIDEQDLSGGMTKWYY